MRLITRSACARAAAAAALFLAAACTDTTNRAALRGDFAETADRAERSGFDYPNMETHEVHSACEALVEARVFGEFFNCYGQLEAKVAAKGGYFRFYTPPIAIVLDEETVLANAAWSETMLKSLRSRAYFFMGDLENAHADSLRVNEITATEVFLTVAQDKAKDGTLYRLVGGDQDREGFKRHFQVQALGMLALIEDFWGDAASAQERIDTLEAFDLDGGANEGSFRSRSAWLARYYLQTGESEKAYAALTAERGKDLNDLAMGIAMLINAVNPIYYATSLEMTGTLSFVEAIDFRSEFEPRFMLHRAELETGRLAEAKAGYDDILAEPRVRGFGSVYWQALHGRGRIAAAEGDLTGAIGYFEQAVDVIEGQRRSIDTEAGRMSFVGDKQEVYRDLIDTLIRADRTPEAFAFAERGKARALVDILASKESFGGRLKPREATLLRRVADEENRAVAEAQKQGSDVRTRSAPALAALKAEAPELASLVTVEALTAAELQALIPAGETLVEYYREGDSLFAFVVDRNRVQAFRLDGAGLEAAVSRFRREVARAGSDGWRRAGGRLHAILIAPLADAVTTERVMVVPHGALHYLPWSAIPTPAGGFLLDDWEVSILPSASVLRFIEPAPAAGSLLAVGNPDLGDPKWDLPGAEAEAVAISRAAGQAETLLRAQATETAVRQRGPSHGVLHLASHGVFDPRSPLSSALLMARDGQNDGRLTASEIYELDLKASLVTLSACETGLGRIQSGDDVVGLTRGFLFSGANAIVSSLWLVDDAATSDLMQAFYAARGEVGAASALRQAQLLLRRSGKDHPYYWAAFQITGRENLRGAGA